jgi:hypothetical protein
MESLYLLYLIIPALGVLAGAASLYISYKKNPPSNKPKRDIFVEMDGIKHHLNSIDKRLNEHGEKIGQIKHSVDEIGQTTREEAVRSQAESVEMDGIKAHLNSIDKRLNEYGEKIDEIKDLIDEPIGPSKMRPGMAILEDDIDLDLVEKTA